MPVCGLACRTSVRKAPMRIAIVAAATILAASASQAEARARFKFRSAAPAVPVHAKAAPVTAKADHGGFLPGAAIGASIGSRPARAREDMTTSSTAPSSTLAPLAAAPAATATAAKSTKPAKPAFVCASDRTVGAGSGFCEMN